MRNGLFLAALLTLSAGRLLAASDAPTNPSWCKPGFICVTVDYFAERTARVWELRADLAKARGAGKRMGWNYGCGFGPAWVVTQGLEVKAFPSVHCGVSFGWRAR